jgi:hypothetical protein
VELRALLHDAFKGRRPPPGTGGLRGR